MRKLATKNKTVVEGVHLRFYKNNITSKKDIFVQYWRLNLVENIIFQK